MLDVRNLAVAYGSIMALKNVSLTVRKGEIVTLIGANGAGKTTLVKTIAGILKPKGGEIVFRGDSIAGTEAHLIARRGITLVPEGRKLVPTMTVEENLRCGAFHRRDMAGIEADLKAVMMRFPHLGERRHQLAVTLSGGESQMVALGRGLMSRPELLMLDEPSLGLAPKLVGEMFSIINELKKEGRTILLIEQRAAEALACSDRAYVIRVGEVVMEGPSQKLLQDPTLREAYLGMTSESLAFKAVAQPA
jgi:branched-chain amino acid transport system ATP-binding protein